MPFHFLYINLSLPKLFYGVLIVRQKLRQELGDYNIYSLVEKHNRFSNKVLNKNNSKGTIKCNVSIYSCE